MDNSLVGKKVLLTCEKELGEEFSKKLENLGAEVFVLPAIEIKPADDWTTMDKYISELGNYDWLIFTSRNAVKYFFQRMEKLKLKMDRQAKTKIAAVGESTKNVIEKSNYVVSFIPEKFTANDLAKTLPDVSGKKILFPHGDKIDRHTIEELKKRGAGVDEGVVYKNEIAEVTGEGVRLLSEKFDFVIFMSPSTVKNIKNFISKSNSKLNYSSIITIGPQTEKAARNEFLHVINADVHNMDGIIKKMVQHDLSSKKIARQ